MTDSRLLIKETFVRLYADVSFERMNIKELCLAVPVARTTFYQHYDSLGDVKSEIEDGLIEGILKLDEDTGEKGKVDDELKAYFDKVLDYIKENREVNKAFLVTHPNLSYISKWKEAIKLHFKNRFPEKTGIPNYGLISEVIACAVLGAYTYWMEHPDEMDAGRITEIAVKALGLLGEII